MGQIVYMQSAICFNDLVELLCNEKLVLGLIFPDTFQCILTLRVFIFQNILLTCMKQRGPVQRGTRSNWLNTTVYLIPFILSITVCFTCCILS